MGSKLTLSVDPRVIAAAKRYAAETGTSVSQLVEDYLSAIVASRPPAGEPPVLARLRGSMPSADTDASREHLARKYG